VSLQSLRLKRWVLSRSPALLWGPRSLFRTYPEPEIHFLNLFAREGTFVDVGASFGMWTYFARRYAKGIVAIEPLPQLAAALRRGFRRAPTVQIHHAALSDRAGTARITMPQLQPGYSTIEPDNNLDGKVNTAYPLLEFEVETRTLDSFAIDDVNLIKIDVEGHEESVLNGARATIERCRPVLVVETEERHKRGAVTAVSSFARDCGYQRFFLHDRALRCGDELCPETHGQVRNLIFLHEQQLERLRSAKRLPFALPSL